MLRYWQSDDSVNADQNRTASLDDGSAVGGLVTNADSGLTLDDHCPGTLDDGINRSLASGQIPSMRRGLPFDEYRGASWPDYGAAYVGVPTLMGRTDMVVV